MSIFWFLQIYLLRNFPENLYIYKNYSVNPPLLSSARGEVSSADIFVERNLPPENGILLSGIRVIYYLKRSTHENASCPVLIMNTRPLDEKAKFLVIPASRRYIVIYAASISVGEVHGNLWRPTLSWAEWMNQGHRSWLS